MRTRRARISGSRPQIIRQVLPQVGQPFKVNDVTSTHLSEIIEDYMIGESSDGLKVSGELTFKPVIKEKPHHHRYLSLDTSWQLNLQQAIEKSPDFDENDQDKFDLLQHAIEKYNDNMKRNVVKMHG